MVKGDSKAVSFRLKTAVVWALEDLAKQWGVSMTEALSKAVLREHGGLTGFATGTPAQYGVINEGKPVVVPATEAEMPSNPNPSAFTGWPITCKHCGEVGARGPSKFGTICYGCKADAHSNNPSDCPKCTLDYGTGAL